MLAVSDDNTTSVFGYDYSHTPPTPFFSYYLSPSNDTTHIDVEE